MNIISDKKSTAIARFLHCGYVYIQDKSNPNENSTLNPVINDNNAPSNLGLQR